MNDLFRSIEAKHSHDNYFGAATGAAEVAKIVAPNSPVDESNGCTNTASLTDCEAGCYFCTPNGRGITQCVTEHYYEMMKNSYTCYL